MNFCKRHKSLMLKRYNALKLSRNKFYHTMFGVSPISTPSFICEIEDHYENGYNQFIKAYLTDLSKLSDDELKDSLLKYESILNR